MKGKRKNFDIFEFNPDEIIISGGTHSCKIEHIYSHPLFGKIFNAETDKAYKEPSSEKTNKQNE